MVIVLADGFSLPAFSGIHFAESAAYPLIASGELGFVLSRAPARIDSGELQLAQLLPSFEVPGEDGETLLIGGGGAWEGEGFVALVDSDTRKARWILYAESAEEFVEANQHGGVVHAKSGGYPHRFEWVIQLGEPPLVTCMRVHTS